MSKTKFDESVVSPSKIRFQERLYAEASRRGARTALTLAGPTIAREFETARKMAPGILLTAIDVKDEHVEAAVRAGVHHAKRWNLGNPARVRAGLLDRYDLVNVDLCGPVSADVPAIHEGARAASMLLNVTVQAAREPGVDKFLAELNAPSFDLSPKISHFSENHKRRIFAVSALVRDTNPGARLLSPNYYKSNNTTPMLSLVFEVSPALADPWELEEEDAEVSRAVIEPAATSKGWNSFKAGAQTCAAGHPRVDPETNESNVGYGNSCRPCFRAAKRTRPRDYKKEMARRIELKRERGEL